MNKKTILIIGAGPAGLTAAYEILKDNRETHNVIIIEKTKDIGGISKTVEFKGNRIDIGGHRFFSKSDRVMEWWKNILPIEKTDNKDLEISYQGKQTKVSSGEKEINPESTDKVMLIRNRLSRIFFLKKFFNYPLTISFETIKNLGIVRMIKIGSSYVYYTLFKINPEKNLEDFFINRFGKELYLTFFKDYTEKVWGAKCTDIPPDWGAQRIKGLSIYTALKNIFLSQFTKGDSIEQKNKETSLIEKFLYPKFGPGQMWQEVLKKVEDFGGVIRKETNIKKIHISAETSKLVGATLFSNNKEEEIHCDFIISSMPIPELISILDTKVPEEVKTISKGLKFRDFLTVGVLLKKMSLNVSKSGIVPDNWIYVQESYVKVGRIQVFNNWSPYMVKDKNTVWIGMEYFCNKGDSFWEMSDEKIKKVAVEELIKLDMVLSGDVIDCTVIRMEKAYPAYFGTYDKLYVVRDFIDRIDNLFLVGRNGMHRYNNQDHSMLTAMESARQIISGEIDKSKIWSINTEQDYHEKK